MRIGVIGGGVVGRATARAFLEHAEVRVYDKVSERSTHSFYDTLNSDLVFITLPTPQKEGSLEFYTGIIETFFATCGVGNKGNFVLRSTVPIGFTRKMQERFNLPNLCHSPEFLTARCSITDAQIPARNIIGVPGGPATLGYDAPCYDRLHDLYESRFPGVPIHNMTSDESEAVKLFTNGFFATKIAYWNEVRCLADRLGMDWDRIMDGVLSDGRIAHSHTKVPGPDGFGFAGACLPKDLGALISDIQKNLGLAHPEITWAAYNRNLRDRTKKA